MTPNGNTKKTSKGQATSIPKNEIKEKLRLSLRKYVADFSNTSTQPLDLLIPKERKIRSIVGGLETSMGTTVWEPIAKTLAVKNGFRVINEKILMPDPYPVKLAAELALVTALRETRKHWISASDCIARLRKVCKSIDRSKIRYVPPPAGTGVDVWVEKGGIEYAFDIKTVQPNVGGIKTFNKQLLEWYAYRICKDPNVKIECKIAYPYNPYKGDFWTYAPHNSGILEPGTDALVENEFWDFLSGFGGTYQQIQEIFTELNNEGLGKELSKMINKHIKAKS